MIKFIGNNLDEIERIFHNLDTDMFMDNPIIQDMTKNFFNFASGQLSSWYYSKVSNCCDEWHVDADGKYSMAISSYPNTTQILIPKTKSAKDFKKNFSNGSTQRDDELLSLIDSGGFTIFQPNPGDIYYLSPRTIHRTNPKAVGNRHLVMRIWNPSLKDIKKSLLEKLQ
jgi:hypothetical protein